MSNQPAKHHAGPNIHHPNFRPASHPAPDDEISLYDLWDVLVRRRWIILAILALVTLAGGTYAWLTPHSYQYRSGIEIGHIYRGEQVSDDRYRPITAAQAAEARLNDLIVPTVRQTLSTPQTSAPRVSVQVRSADNAVLLTTLARDDQNHIVERLHTAIAEALREHHQPIYDRELGLILDQLSVQANVLEREIAIDRQQLNGTEAQEDTGSENVGIIALVEGQRLADLRRSLAQKQSHLARLRSNMEAVTQASRTTQLSFLASRSEEPSGAGRSLTLALSIVLGLMGGVFTAFFWEFIHNARQRQEWPSAHS